jgi:hypothetical protein
MVRDAAATADVRLAALCRSRSTPCSTAVMVAVMVNVANVVTTVHQHLGESGRRVLPISSVTSCGKEVR